MRPWAFKTFLPVSGDPEFLGDLKGPIGKEGGPSTSFKGPWSRGKGDGKMTSKSLRTKEISSLACGLRRQINLPHWIKITGTVAGAHSRLSSLVVGSPKSLAVLQTSPSLSGLFVPLGHYLKIKIRSSALSESHSDSHGD